MITLSGILLGFVLAGSIPVERAFGTPGLGYAMFTAVSERDVFVMQNLVFLYAVVFVMLNILVDRDDRLARPEDPLPMTATEPETAYPLEPVAPPARRRGCARAAARAAEFRPALAAVGVLGLHRGGDHRRWRSPRR